jgi:cytochrome P450
MNVIDYDARRDPNAPSNLLSMSPGEEHTRRRRLWSHGLAGDVLKEYEEVIARRGLQLAEGLERSVGKPSVDLTNWINFFT